MKRYEVDCSSVSSFDDLVASTNTGFLSALGAAWNGNLDALNDFLGWPDERCEVVLLSADVCRAALGHAAYASWLRQARQRCHPDNVASLTTAIARAERGEGETLYDVIRAIFDDNAELVLLTEA